MHAAKPQRKPEQTRDILLQAAFHEIHLHGFQSASLERILANTGLTKGALYHHFGNKQELGYAVVEEVLRAMIHEHWLKPLEGQDDPLTAFKQMLVHAAKNTTVEFIELGCPLNNLAQEMSPLDEGFRTRCDALFAEWRNGIAAAFTRGIQAGTVRADLNARAVAMFTLAAMEGCIGLAKSARSLEALRECGAGLMHYLESLRNSK